MKPLCESRESNVNGLRIPYAILFLMIVTLGIYYPVIFAPFNSVDDWNMLESLLNSGEISFRDILFPNSTGYYYRPLLYYTFVLDRDLWGLQENIMHLENIIIHSLNVILVYFAVDSLINVIGEPRKPIVSLLAAIVFSIHPINTEAVNWISGRTDLLAGTFLLFSILGVLNAIKRPSMIFYVLSSLSFFLACLCKETAIFFLPAIFAIAFVKLHPSEKLSIVFKENWRYSMVLSFIVMTIIYFIVRHAAFSLGDNGIRTALQGTIGSEANLLYNLKVFLKIIGFYAKKILIPWPQNFAIISVNDGYIFVGVIVILLCIFLSIRRDLPSVLTLASIFLVCSSLLVVMSRMAWTPVAERYLYLPSIPFSIALSVSLRKYLEQFQYGGIAAFGLVAFLVGVSWSTVNRNIIWQDNLKLFADTVAKSPDFPPAWNELAVALNASGRTSEAKEIFKKNRLESSLKNREYGLINAAGALVSEGKLDEANEILLLNLDPKSKNYLNMLKKIVEINDIRIAKNKSQSVKNKIKKENIRFLLEIQKITKDPFYYYRIGQIHLSVGDKLLASRYFDYAAKMSSPDAYYHEPAQKLANRLGNIK